LRKLNALVTGGAGFIGTELVKQLRSSDLYDEVYISDVNFEESDDKKHYHDLRSDYIHDFIDRKQIDVVFGLAALIGGIKYFHDHPAEILYENNQITGNTLESIRVSKRKPVFVYISSSMVFESATVFPTPEDHIYECPLPKSAYGFSKLVGEIVPNSTNNGNKTYKAPESLEVDEEHKGFGCPNSDIFSIAEITIDCF
jgi:nucleoside-diphosphate-sugar epimerase